MNISGKTKQALQILNKNGEIGAEAFAKQMWPRSDYWHKPYQTRSGAKMICSASGYLGKLKNESLVVRKQKGNEITYRISAVGKKALGKS
jgi:hypothetical protein